MLMNKSDYLGHTMLEISKIVLCEFWYDYVKPKYVQKAKLCNILLNGVTFKQILQNIIKQDLILQIMNQPDHYPEEKIKILLNL